MERTWSVYVVECADGSLYTGATTDLERRVKQHNAGTGASFTRSRRPVRLVWSEPAGTRSQALKRESEIKRFSRQRKLRLVRGAA